MFLRPSLPTVSRPLDKCLPTVSSFGLLDAIAASILPPIPPDMMPKAATLPIIRTARRTEIPSRTLVTSDFLILMSNFIIVPPLSRS